MIHKQPCQVTPLEKPIDLSHLPNTVIAYLTVQGMSCERCAVRVRNGLLSSKNVIAADVFLENKLAAVAYDPSHILPVTLLRSVKRSGQDGQHCYKAKILKMSSAASVLGQTSDTLNWNLPDGTQRPMTRDNAPRQS